MIIIKSTNTNEYLKIVNNSVKNKSTLLGIGISDKLTVYDTNKGHTNFEACERLGAYVIPYVANGSTVVSSPGDLGVYFGIPGRHYGWSVYVRKQLKRFLEIQGLKTIEENNDLTIYGKKVLGYTEHVNDQYSSGSMFIAMTNSQELVNEICLKPKTRFTAGLNDFGFTATEIIEVIEKATKEYLKLIGGK